MCKGVAIMDQSLLQLTIDCVRCPAKISILNGRWYKDLNTNEIVCYHCFTEEELDHKYHEVNNGTN